MEKKFKQEEKARKQEEKRQEKLAWAATSKSERRANGRWYIRAGAVAFGIGLAITVGASYLIQWTGFGLLAWGALGTGIFMVVKGIWRVVSNQGDDPVPDDSFEVSEPP